MNRTKNSIDDYKNLGAEFRLFKTLASKLSIDASKFMTKEQWRRMDSAIEKVNSFASPIEDRMFKEHPEVSNDYTCVFYGTTQNSPRHEVEADVLDRAEKLCKSLFY